MYDNDAPDLDDVVRDWIRTCNKGRATNMLVDIYSEILKEHGFWTKEEVKPVLRFVYSIYENLPTEKMFKDMLAKYQNKDIAKYITEDNIKTEDKETGEFIPITEYKQRLQERGRKKYKEYYGVSIEDDLAISKDAVAKRVMAIMTLHETSTILDL